MNVSSWGHRHSDIVWDDPNYERRDYDPLGAYGQSKTANILFAVEIDRRGRGRRHPRVRAPPGQHRDERGAAMSVADLQALGLVDDDGEPIIDPARNMKTPAQGAATSVWCAASPQLDGLGGVYCENCDVAPLVADVRRSAGDERVRLEADRRDAVRGRSRLGDAAVGAERALARPT